MHGSLRRVAVLLAVAASVAALAPNASARLRSPRLEASCPSGYAYGEHTFGALRIEGCSKAQATDERTNQRLYRGDLEINGLLVEPDGTDDLKAWTDSTLTRDGLRMTISSVGHAKRTATTRLLLDARIGGQQRKIRLFTGNLDLQAAGGAFNLDGVSQPAGSGAIPISGGPTLFGLRLRSSLDARFDEDGTTFPATLSLGSVAPGPLKDVTGDADVEVVDGTGMRITGLQFHVPRFELPGIGGMRNFRIDYDGGNDRWRGHVKVDLGELFGGIEVEFEVEVNASTGAPTYIRMAVDDLNFPIGQSGIFLQGARGAFGFDPLLVAAGLTATAGPRVGGFALIEISGDLELRFEPTFHLEAIGTARVLPTGPSSQLGSGRIEIEYDAEGYVRIFHRQRYEALVLGIGPSATLEGEGEYATDRNRFNISASATGRLELGPLGGFDVVRLGAVVSSDGWGACGELGDGIFSFLSGGIGQEWDRGMDVILGCDLAPYRAQVRTPTRTPRAGVRGLVTVQETTFTIPQAPVTAVRVQASAPGPTFRLIGPGGVGVNILPTRGGVDPAGPPVVAWLGAAASDATYVFLKNAPAGTYTLRWLSSAPAITGVSTAQSAPAIRATASVARRPAARPGIRRLAARVTSGLAAGETLAISVVGPNGAIPVGVLGAGRPLDLDVAERGTGTRTIVGQVVRNGVPLPGRRIVLGRYTATQPPAPASIRVKRVGRTRKVRIAAIARRTAERPDGWAYLVRALGRTVVLRGAVGKPVTVLLPRRARLTVAVRPIVDDRVLRGKPRVRTLRKV